MKVVIFGEVLFEGIVFGLDVVVLMMDDFGVDLCVWFMVVFVGLVWFEGVLLVWVFIEVMVVDLELGLVLNEWLVV